MASTDNDDDDTREVSQQQQQQNTIYVFIYIPYAYMERQCTHECVFVCACEGRTTQTHAKALNMLELLKKP